MPAGNCYPACMSDPFENVVWHDVLELGLLGQLWPDEPRENPYDRLPVAIKPLIETDLWNLGTQAAGLHVEFESDAKNIFVKFQLEPREDFAAYSAPSGTSGLDCYGMTDQGEWRWVGCQEAFNDPDCSGRMNNLPLDGQLRRYRVYLPLRRRVLSMQVGACETIQPVNSASRDQRLPVIYYGTSIVHGAGVSRSGICHAAQVARKLDRQVINLGFCGRARCEPAMAELIGRAPGCLYVLDVLPNNGEKEIEPRLTEFLRILRKAQPTPPILLVGDRVFGDATFAPERGRVYQAKNEALQRVFNSLTQQGITNLHLAFHPSWYGEDNEGTTDASHPNDLGATRMAERLQPYVEELVR